MKKRKRRGSVLLLAVVAALCVILGYAKADAKAEEKSLQNKKKNLQTQIENENERRETLTEEQAYRQTKSYIEDQAWEKLGLVKQDDVLLKEKEDDE